MEFPGFVVSDWESVGELINHGVAADGAEARGWVSGRRLGMEMVTMHATTVKQQCGRKNS
jgi:beta-glucosidase